MQYLSFCKVEVLLPKSGYNTCLSGRPHLRRINHAPLAECFSLHRRLRPCYRAHSNSTEIRPTFRYSSIVTGTKRVSWRQSRRRSSLISHISPQAPCRDQTSSSTSFGGTSVSQTTPYSMLSPPGKTMASRIYFHSTSSRRNSLRLWALFREVEREESVSRGA
jgi:hypothetical protein